MTPRARLATAALAVGMILTPVAGCSQNDQNQNDQNQNQNDQNQNDQNQNQNDQNQNQNQNQ